MKRLLLLALSLGGSAATAQAQATEWTLHATSGYFSYRGASATGTSFINGSDVSQVSGYTNNPYGNRFTLSYGGAGQVQRVTARHLVLGAQAGYEHLRSRVEIDGFFYSMLSSSITPATGQTMLTSRFINTHLFGGRRFVVGPVNLDATVGPEIGIMTGAQEKGEASGGGTTVRTSRERANEPTTDLRARANLTAYYQRFGLSVGYSRGSLNYQGNYVGGINEAYGQMLRAALAYRLN